MIEGLSNSEESHACDTLTGKRLVQLMRKHRWTIERLAHRLGTTQKRVRKAREKGLTNQHAIRDWLEVLTGTDPGPLPRRFEIGHHTEEGECCFCGCPLYLGDTGFEYVGEMFCSVSCARQSRGWS
ncbi:hypothetical protein SH449x_000205 [Pirellulaceae bacterium SH449]